jgi:hypothetical protein
MTRDTFDRFQPQERGLFGDNEHEQVRTGRGPRVTGSSDLKDLTLNLHDERPLAICVSDPDKVHGPKIWLPKSLIEYEHAAGGKVVVTLPGWLVEREGLV